MPSPRFDANIVTAGNRLHDNRTLATADPLETTLRYSATLLTKYQNAAIRATIRDAYLRDPENFALVMPEMIGISGTIALTSGVGTLPTDCWVVLEVSKSDYTWYAWRIRDNRLKVLAGRDGMIQPTATKPAFYQTATTIVVLPTSITGVNAVISYVKLLADMTINNSTDIPISTYWDEEIVERMVAMGNADAKSSIAL